MIRYVKLVFNSNITFDTFQPFPTLLVRPPITITPLPMGEVTIAGLSKAKGRSGPEMQNLRFNL